MKLLNSWARWNPVVLLQVLPEYMWARTALRRAEPVGLVASRPAVANAGLKKISWKDSSLRDVARDEVPVPVVALEPSMLGTWAQWMVNSKQDIMPGFVLKSSAEKQSDRSKNKIVSPEERIKHFWAVASPTARRLATLMTVIPLFNLHILRLVRESSLDQKGQQIHEAEFILSGLIQIKHKHIDPDEVFYEFYEGVVPLLRDALPAPDAIAVLKELFLGKISHYIGEHLGQIRDFQAALATPKAYKGKLLPVDNNSFARILIDDLRWLGGDYADLVRESSEVDIEIQLDEITTGDVSMNVSVEMRDTPKCVVQSSQFWERLLRDIRRHVVVPIVGKDLLTIEVDGRSITLERFLAEKLAESCGKPLGDNQDLRHAIVLYKESTNDPKLKYLRFHISKILREQPPPIPKPLLQLAVIDGFTLYVTTYFDSLLHQALLEAKRCRANELQALAFDPKRGSGRVEEGGRQWDLFPDFKLDRQQTPVVYHLFGMDGPDPDGNDREDYAVTEEDLLEYLVLAVQPHHQPSKLFEILHSSRLLVLGTSYPDWLARFFLRLVTAQRLSAQHNARQLWVDRQCDSNSELAFFLQDYSMDTDLCFSEDPVRFVDLLHQKWQAFKTVEESKPTGSVSTPRAWETKRGKIFISYASEDRTVMETFAGALEKAGLDIWWDKNIEAARKWEEFIEQQIEEACVFVALLSHHTTDPGISAVVSLRPSDRVFRREWKAAFERNENFFALIENLSFLFISMMSIGILLALKNLWKKNCKELKHRTETRLSRF